MSAVTIYALCEPDTGEIRYVGKSANVKVRYAGHRSARGSTPIKRWLVGLRERGVLPTLQVLEECDALEWEARERAHLNAIRESGARLLNIAIGGSGAPGVIPSAETRQRLSAAKLREWKEHPRGISPEHVRALQEGLKRRPRDWYHKVAAKLRGRKKSPEECARMSAARLGKSTGPRSEKTKALLARQKMGERNPQAKLTYEKADEIRCRYAAGGISLSGLGREYAIDTKQVHRIVRGQAWVRPVA